MQPLSSFSWVAESLRKQITNLNEINIRSIAFKADWIFHLYEGSENFAALTSFGVVPAFGGLTGLVSGKVPGLDIDLSKVSMRKHTACIGF